MWHSMFAEQIPLAEKILRTVIVYAVIALLFRLSGKRGLALSASRCTGSSSLSTRK